MKFVSELTNKIYDSVDELEKAEAEVKAEQNRKEKLKEARAERAKEVEEAFKAVNEAQKHANELLTAFCKDYGAWHKTYHDVDEVPLFNSVFDFFKW